MHDLTDHFNISGNNLGQHLEEQNVNLNEQN